MSRNIFREKITVNLKGQYTVSYGDVAIVKNGNNKEAADVIAGLTAAHAPLANGKVVVNNDSGAPVTIGALSKVLDNNIVNFRVVDGKFTLTDQTAMVSEASSFSGVEDITVVPVSDGTGNMAIIGVNKDKKTIRWVVHEKDAPASLAEAAKAASTALQVIKAPSGMSITAKGATVILTGAAAKSNVLVHANVFGLDVSGTYDNMALPQGTASIGGADDSTELGVNVKKSDGTYANTVPGVVVGNEGACPEAKNVATANVAVHNGNKVTIHGITVYHDGTFNADETLAGHTGAVVIDGNITNAGTIDIANGDDAHIKVGSDTAKLLP